MIKESTLQFSSNLFTLILITGLITIFQNDINCQIKVYSNGGSDIAPFGAGIGSTTQIREIKYAPKLKGSTYLYDDWSNANIVFIKDTSEIADLMIKLDIHNNVVEIKYNEEIKILPGSMVLNVILQDKNEIYVTRNTLETVEPEGFLKIVYNKRSSLLCHYSTKIKKSNYNEAMAVGNRDDEIVKVTTYYALIDNELLQLENTRGKLTEQFEKYPDIVNYINENKVNPKKEDMLIALFQFIDSRK